MSEHDLRDEFADLRDRLARVESLLEDVLNRLEGHRSPRGTHAETEREPEPRASISRATPEEQRQAMAALKTHLKQTK